jgi:hypothetical protein
VAVVIEVCMQHLVVRELPPIPRYTVGVNAPTGTIIAPNGGGYSHDPLLIIPLSDEQREAIYFGKANLWVYGFIATRDFLGRRHKHRFCGAWHGVDPDEGSDEPNGFLEGGPAAYHGSSIQDRDTGGA